MAIVFKPAFASLEWRRVSDVRNLLTRLLYRRGRTASTFSVQCGEEIVNIIIINIFHVTRYHDILVANILL